MFDKTPRFKDTTKTQVLTNEDQDEAPYTIDANMPEPDTDSIIDNGDMQMNMTPDGGMEATISMPNDVGSAEPQAALAFTDNLTPKLDEAFLTKMGGNLLSMVQDDAKTREEWDEIYATGLKLLGFKVRDTEQEVFPDSCTVTHPVLAESIVKYQAKARSQLLPAGGPAKTQILGRQTPDKKARSERVKEFMNWQITTQMPEYGPEHDRMLFHQGFGGHAITKLYYDADEERPVSRFIRPHNFIIDYNAIDLRTAYRYAEIIEMHGNDLRRHMSTGFYRDVPMDAAPQVDTLHSETARQIAEIEGRTVNYYSEDKIYKLYEVHTYAALEGDADDRTPEEREAELELPYIITIDADKGHILAIRRNWREGDPRKRKRLWYVSWPLIPGLGFYGYGYVHIIGGLAKTATTSMRQLVDAGMFASMSAGFKAYGLRVVGNSGPFKPGEWREVNAPGMDLSKAMVPLPYREPSPTLMNMMTAVVQAAQKFADSADQVVSEAANYGPVGTTMALLDAGGKLFTAIHERLFESQKQELALLREINAETLPDNYPYEAVGAEKAILKGDFGPDISLVPVTDPRAPTEAHRLAKANATLSIAQQFPTLHNMSQVLFDLHSSLGTDDPARYLVPQAPPPQPQDPISENQALLKGTPVTAADWQDHDAHIQVHQALVSNPAYNQNQGVMSTTMAHIQEHLAEKFRVEITALLQKSGAQVPPPGQPLPPAQEAQVAQAAAAAVKALPQGTGQDDPANDPVMQLQMMELDLRRQELILKHDGMMLKDKEHQATLLAGLEETREKVAGMIQAALIRAAATKGK